MHPSISQAVSAERIREWQQSAARDRLARQAGHKPIAALPRRRHHRAAVPNAVTEEQLATAGDRQPVGSRAA